jgi:hypothetical protein
MWIDSIAQDVRFALRLIRRQPLLTLAAVLTVALGVGANTAVTSVLETALVNPLGLGDAGNVVVASVRIEKLQRSLAARCLLLARAGSILPLRGRRRTVLGARRARHSPGRTGRQSERAAL